MIKISLIEDVSNQIHCIVTTTSAHMLETGMVVVIRVPRMYRMEFYAKARVRVIDFRRFATDINTTELEPFILPEKISCRYAYEPAHCFRSLAEDE